MKRLFTLLLCVFIYTGISAQNIRVVKDSEVSRVMDQYGATNRMNGTISGWRIQLLSTTDRGKMEMAKEEFMVAHPFIPIDFIHASPYYKLLAGAFATKLDTYRVLHQIKRDFPSAYPAQDKNIRVGELIGR